MELIDLNCYEEEHDIYSPVFTDQESVESLHDSIENMEKISDENNVMEDSLFSNITDFEKLDESHIEKNTEYNYEEDGDLLNLI